MLFDYRSTVQVDITANYDNYFEWFLGTLLIFFVFYFLTMNKKCKKLLRLIWKSPILSELTPIVFNTGLTHLGSEAST